MVTVRSLQKWHGAGNDFLVDVQRPGESPTWSPDFARALCHRATGVGADGLIVAVLGQPVTMTLFNADGSLAEMSGNGVRCLAAAVLRATSSDDRELAVATAAGLKVVHLAMDSETSGSGSVEMGEVTLGDDIDGAWGVANVGNPHVAVLDNEQWNDVSREEIAAKLAAQVGGANVEFVTLLGPDHLSIRVIERGVGWTLACGTGSCAVAALARRAGLSGDSVTVENPGGTLHVELVGSNATLRGPVQFIADVEWPDA
jgi:diaminopimelate epimerase